MKKILYFLFIFLLPGLYTAYAQEENPLQATYDKANKKLESGEYKSAILDYGQLINSKFDNKEVYVKRGIAYFNTKAFEEAKSDFDAAVKARIDQADLFGYRGLTKYELKDYQGAVSDLEKAVGMGFKQPGAFF